MQMKLYGDVQQMLVVVISNEFNDANVSATFVLGTPEEYACCIWSQTKRVLQVV